MEQKTKKTLLLHACCGPCSSAVLERLYPDHDITVFYYNPNITDEGEYRMREEELKHFLEERTGRFRILLEGRSRHSSDKHPA